jgi:predicted permease
MEILLKDIAYAFRQLRQSPGFAAVAIITLGLGIGANTSLFSVVNGVLLKRLPYPQPERLVTLSESKPNFEYGAISYPNFRDWQKQNRTFSAMAIYRSYAFSLTGSGEAEQVSGEFVSADLFPLLGVKPVIGRSFAPDEDQVGAGPVALISSGLWRRKFNSAPDIVGNSITLDGRNYTLIGVIPASFHFAAPSFPERRDVFVPIGQWSNPLLLKRGAGLGIHGLGRLKPGITFEQGQADMDAVSRNLSAAFPDVNKGVGAKLDPLKHAILGDIPRLLFVLLAGVGFVLLIACVNVANLLLARSTGRTREFAIRASLGASHGRVVRQLLTESVLLGLAGGALGWTLAALCTRAALGVLPTALPRAEEIAIDLRVLLFTLSISLFAGIIFGLAPALKTSRTDLHESLKEGGRGASGTRHRTQNIFIVGEMAMALVLLTGAGLMIRSLTRLWNVDPGFDPHNVLNFGISLPPSMMKASPDAIRAAFRDLDNRLASIPGVTAVSQTWGAIPIGPDDEQLFWLQGQPKPANDQEMNWAVDYIVGPDYRKAMGISLLSGRFLTSQDNEHAPLVVVIDKVLADKYFPNQNPIGKGIQLKTFTGPVQIVGVVGHVKQWGLDVDDVQTPRAQIYLSGPQMPDEFMAMTPSGSSVMIRTAGAVPGLLDSIRRVSQQMSSQQAIFGAQSMDDLIADSLASQRFSMIILGVFAALALLLASVGIYGVVSYVVGQRTHEIGIRMALGASRMDILRLFLGSSGELTLSGVGVGLAAALGLTRLIARMLYGISATDPLTFAAVSAVLIFVALLATYLPARRASRVDPMVALRYE